MIPATIHQIWVPGARGAEPLPMPLVRLVQRWRDLHPTWTHQLWTDDDLGWLANRDLYDRAAELVPAHSVGQLRADLARWEVLWHHGGVYADVDFEPLQPIDWLCNRPWVTESAARRRLDDGRPLVANGLIALPPHHPLADRMIAAVRHACEHADGGRQASRVTGPWLLSRMLVDWDVEVRPADEFYPYRWDELDDDFDASGCVAVHHWWHRRQQRHRTEGVPCSS